MQQAPGPGSHALLGRVIAGKFRVDRVLAEGGMGLVVAATHLHLDQPVALKLPRGEIIANAEALARFTREAKAAAQLKSEYVARVFDAGVTVDGPYMVMEYLEGHSLSQVLELQGRLDIESATEYAIQVCEGLSEAHARGIVHRDVKPDNLFLVERAPGWQIVKLLDFGISKISFAEKGNLKTSIIMGSPCYMSPEQLRSTATVDHRTDLWSLGATLYELLVGVGPFDGTQPLADLFVSILERTPRPLREIRPEIPELLAAVVMRCLEKDREARFQSAGDIAMALLPFAPARARDTAERAVSMPSILRRSRAGAERTALAVDEGWGPYSEPPEAPAGDAYSQIVPVRSFAPSTPDGVTPLPSVSPVAAETLVSERRTEPSAHAVTPPPPPLSDPKSPVQALRSLKLGLPPTKVTLAVAAILLATALVARPHMQTASRTAMAMPAETPAPAVASELPLPVEPQRTSELFVRASPASARVTIDGVLVTENPFRARYPRSEVHVVGASAPGYEAKYESVSLANDVFIDVSLAARTATATRSAPTVTVTRTRRSVPAAASGPAVSAGGATAGVEVPASVPSVEVDPGGGHAVFHPIEANNPYGAP